MDAKDTKMESLGIKGIFWKKKKTHKKLIFNVIELEKPGQQNQDFNRSMSTVITQLSNDSSNHTENFTSGEGTTSSTMNDKILQVSWDNQETLLIPELSVFPPRVNEAILLIGWIIFCFLSDCVPNFEKYKPSLDPTKEMSPRERQFCEVVWRLSRFLKIDE